MGLIVGLIVGLAVGLVLYARRVAALDLLDGLLQVVGCGNVILFQDLQHLQNSSFSINIPCF